jgi:SAM-dependent methyltransferase
MPWPGGVKLFEQSSDTSKWILEIPMDVIKKLFVSRKFKNLRKLIDPESERLRSFVRMAAEGIYEGSVVVDVGAGECQYKDLFPSHRYIAVDFAAGDAGWDYSQLDVQGDIHALPFRSGTVDLVLCTQVLEHAREPQRVVDEIARILKPGGKVFFTVPQGWGEHQVPHDYFRYTRFGMEVLCSRAGLIITEAAKTTGLFGYLTNRLTMIPKVLFWDIRHPAIRIFLFPLELLCYFIFVAVPPILLEPLDVFDKEKVYTLNYTIVAKALK